MTWFYSQSTGKLRQNEEFIGIGYSGAGFTLKTGRNNPNMQHVPNCGPLPQGKYVIGKSYQHPKKGPICMNLSPVGHKALGRSGFMIHGNNAENNASQGCIILGPDVRKKIAQSNDNKIEVTP